MQATADPVEARLADLQMAAIRLEPGNAPFPLWLVKVERPPSASAFALLSAFEQHRARRFHTGQLHDRYIAAHAALRLLIERSFGIPAGRQQFEIDALGKPSLVGLPKVEFSISYSGDHVLIGVTSGAPIGVDIEQVRRIEDADDLMRIHYTRSEQAVLNATAPESLAFHRMFLGVWTRKEACVKAVGQGLNLALSMIECGVGDGVRTVRVGLTQLRTDTTLISSDYVAAWACGTVSEPLCSG